MDKPDLDALLDDPANKVEEHEGWHFGDRAVAITDNEEEGLSAGESGYILIEKVGAPEYNNVRTGLYLVVDGRDVAIEVTPEQIESV